MGVIFLAQQVARLIAILPAVLHLVLVKTAHAPGGIFQGLPLGRVDILQGRSLPLPGYLQFCDGSRLQLVKAGRVFQQRLVSTQLDIGNNGDDRLVD